MFRGKRDKAQKFVPTVQFRLAVGFGLPLLLTVFNGWFSMSSGGERPASSVLTLPWLLLFTTAVTVLLLAAAFFHLRNIVCDGLDRQARSFKYLAETLDLSRRSAARRMDEFGRGAVWFDRFMQRLEQTVLTVQASTESVSLATQEIAAGNLDLSARTENQAASLGQTAASMGQLTQAVKMNSDNVLRAKELASAGNSLADAGNHAVQAMVATIERINTESIRISEITGMIEGIAFQTNILALNAAVEAARAGDQGRGFAVVAGEVRALAQRSSSAAKEIKGLIGDTASLVRNGSSQAVDVGASIGQVKAAIGHLSVIVEEIASASETQSQGIEQIAQAVANMDEVTQQNAALVEEAAAAAQSLEEQVVTVRTMLSEFKVEGPR